MEIQAILVGGVLFAITMVFTLVPIFQSARQDQERRGSIKRDLHNLETQLDRLVESVHDLDFDFDTGKINEEVYTEQRKMLIGRGVSLLIQIDRMNAQLEVSTQKTDDDQWIEQAIAQRRQHTTNNDDIDDLLEAEIAARREVSS